MKRGMFSHEALKLALSAIEPDVCEADRTFALDVAIDLLPRVTDSSAKGALRAVMVLLQLVEPWRRPTHRLRQALGQQLAKDDELRRVVDESVAATMAARRERFPRKDERP